METKHTKGEWKSIRPEGSNGFYYVTQGLGNGSNICCYLTDADSQNNNEVEVEANAKLIAASPDLLEALMFLKQAYEQLVDCGDCGNWNPRTDNCIIQAKQAIEKATK